MPHVFANGGGTEEGGMESEGGGACESNSDDEWEDYDASEFRVVIFN